MLYIYMCGLESCKNVKVETLRLWIQKQKVSYILSFWFTEHTAWQLPPVCALSSVTQSYVAGS